MSNFIDVPRLIAEVQKRPAIWDGRPKVRQFVPKKWLEIAATIGADVKLCKRKWKNLRDTYRAEVRRYLRHHQSNKLMASGELNIANCKSKWMYFTSLTFLNESKQFDNIDNEINNSNAKDRNHLDDANNSCSISEQNVHVNADIKLEPSDDYTEMSQNFDGDEDDDTANDLLFEEFENMTTTPQAALKLSAAFSMNNEIEKKPIAKELNVVPYTATTTSKCKCSQNNDEKVNFLQDLGREEQKLMKSTQQDVIRCNNLDHIGDFDYNFLVSFLPQMKKMNELQNLRFRARMSELVLSILTDTTTTQDIPKVKLSSTPQQTPN